MLSKDCLKLGCVRVEYQNTFGQKTLVCRGTGKIPEDGPCPMGLESEIEPGKKSVESPEFYLYFLKLRTYGEYPPGWICIDQIKFVKALKIVPDGQTAPFYRVVVTLAGYDISNTIDEVATREEADVLVERVMMEVSMRLSQLYGTGRRSS